MSNNILCVANWNSDVGYAWWLMERFWEAIAKHYPGRVTICYPKIDTLSERITSCGAEIVEFDYDTGDWSRFAKQRGIRHVYLTDRPYFSSRYLKMRMGGVKSIIVHDHTPGERSTPPAHKLAVKRARFAFRPCVADAYLSVSNFVRERHVNTVGIPASLCHVAQNGIDLGISFEPHDIRAELGLPRDALVCVSSSRAAAYKRIHHIIQAAASVPDVHFAHCGDGPDMPMFRAEVERLGLEGRFFLLGARHDVPNILASADMAVHASTGEVGTSLSILEFQRAGLPIVLPADRSVCQSVRDGVSALLYRPCDIDHLASHLRRLASDKALRSTLGHNANGAMIRYNILDTVANVLSVFVHLGV